jgi:hypothetical protein
MTRPKLLTVIVEALQAAGATEEMIAAAVGAYGAWERAPRRQGGRPRKYQNRAECDRAYRERRKLREKTCENTFEKTSPDEKTCEKTQPRRNEMRYEISGSDPLNGAGNLRVRLLDASHGNADPAADVAPIRALLDQGCDLEADVVLIVAREVPDLPRPLRNWGAPWLVRDILAARDQRLAGRPVEAHRPPGA